MFDDVDTITTAQYEKAMYQLEAKETLATYTANDWPNLAKHVRERLHRQIHRAAFPNSKPRGLTFADLAKIEGMGRI